MLNKHNLNIAKLASGERSRFTLDAIRVTSTETVVTDGHLLVKVSNPNMPVEQFPELPNSTITNDFQSFNLPSDAALKLSKSLPKRSTIPILSCAAVDVAGETPNVVTTDLENVTRCKSGEGNFPDYERIMPKEECMRFEITVDAFLLKALMDQYVSFLPDRQREKKMPVRLIFKDANSAILMTGKGGDEQTMTAVLMPMRNEGGPASANFKRRTELESACKEFAGYRYEFEGGSVNLESEGARLLSHARLGFGIPQVAEPIVEETEVAA